MAVLKNIVSKIFNLSTTPAKKTEGQFWYDTTNNVLKRSDGADYKPLAVGDNLISAGSTDTVKGILDSKANASDLASYLPLTGGTINGNVENPAPLIINDTAANCDGYVSDVGLVVRGTWFDERTETTYNLSTKITPVSITGDAVTSSIISGSNKLLTSGGAYTALQSKANVSDVVTLTGDQTISGSKTFNNITIDNLNGNTTDVDGVKISTNTNSIELYAATYTDESNTPYNNIFTKIDAKKLEISKTPLSGITESIQIDANNIKFSGEDRTFDINVYDGINMHSSGGGVFGNRTNITSTWILSQNNLGLSITSGGNHFIVTNTGQDAVSQLMGSRNDVFGEIGTSTNFVGYSIGTGLELDGSGDLSNYANNNIFRVGYYIDYDFSEFIPEISGSLVDKTISSSSLDTHIPTSKAVYTSLANKQDKLQYYTESPTSTMITDATMMGMLTISNGDIRIDGFNAVNIGVASDTGSITLNSKTVLNGSISGSAIASKISNSSTTIPSTSAVYSALQSKADNTNVVHLSGDEVITGNKLFTSSIRFSSGDTFNTNLAGVSVPEPEYNPGTPPTLIIDSNSNITIDASNVIDTGLYYSYGTISGVNWDGESFRIDSKYGDASFSSLSTGSISGSAVVSTIGTSTTSTKLPTEGAVVKAISDVKTSLGSALTYEGSVENYSNLPTGLTASDKGKVYNVVNANGNIPAGTNYAWNGTSWDALGGDMSAYLRKEGDTTLELGSSIDDETGYTMIPGKITVNGEYHGQYTEITKDQIALESDVGSTLINGGRLYLDDRRGTNMKFIIDYGIGGTLVDTSIPSTPEDGHIATTGAIKTYVDNSTSNKVEKNSDANLTSIVMPTFSSSTGVQNGSAKLKLYKDDTTGAITIEIEEVE